MDNNQLPIEAQLPPVAQGTHLESTTSSAEVPFATHQDSVVEHARDLLGDATVSPRQKAELLWNLRQQVLRDRYNITIES